MMREKAATMLQSAFRGFVVRKNQTAHRVLFSSSGSQDHDGGYSKKRISRTVDTLAKKGKKKKK